MVSQLLDTIKIDGQLGPPGMVPLLSHLVCLLSFQFFSVFSIPHSPGRGQKGSFAPEGVSTVGSTSNP
jgi:hypothetical protein